MNIEKAVTIYNQNTGIKVMMFNPISNTIWCEIHPSEDECISYMDSDTLILFVGKGLAMTDIETVSKAIDNYKRTIDDICLVGLQTYSDYRFY